MKTLSNYPAKLFIGINNNEKIYLSAPSWDCSWYWGFGYLGNINCHYHVDGLSQYNNINLFDAFKKHFGTSLVVRDSQLWTLCELFKTFYKLKETAEVLGRGGSHLTNNPCSKLIINKDEVSRINNAVLPAIFEEIYKILIPAQQNDAINLRLVKLSNEGNILEVVSFMHEYKITTNDLKNITGIAPNEFNNIHSKYWELHHATK